MFRHRSSSRSLGASGAVAVALAILSRPAFGQEWHAGARAGVATLAHANPGPALDLHGAYGIGDMFDLLVEVVGSHHGGDRDSNVFSADGGIAYKIDVVQWIPYVGLLGGFYHYAGPTGPHGHSVSTFGAAASLGLDYLLERDLTLGADVTLHTSFVGGVSAPYFTALLGAEYRWGF